MARAQNALFFLLGSGLLAAAPLQALAADGAVIPTAPKVNPIERGFFFEAGMGFGTFLSSADRLSLGAYVAPSMYVGYDILPVLSVGIGLDAMAASGDDTPSRPLPKGDVFLATPSAFVQLAVLSTFRDFLWVRALGGFALASPEVSGDAPFAESGPMFGAKVGFEHFAKLRHFSFGLTVDFRVYTKPETAMALGAGPLFKYTF